MEGTTLKYPEMNGRILKCILNKYEWRIRNGFCQLTMGISGGLL
jgi:hypothetical protein